MDATKPIVLVVSGRLGAGDVSRLCDELVARLRGGGVTEVVCDVRGLERPNLAAVDALARLRLTARRRAVRLRVAGAGRELLLLLDLVGLADLVGPYPDRDDDP
ncbi:STAS domain-containing protein [Streptomyces liangshanensis]|uniref:STAS domain-containing protein n=1 Tax=Streptomyces liangshanensis TaxID=2717324 RepID=A0A6G9GY90_9ACTN|nr:STAS domain-containing protein [Streptomyces liangshanensis]QIQ03019.1 STAS domain-containing protein [Streptomyces liangshanensis]